MATATMTRPTSSHQTAETASAQIDSHQHSQQVYDATWQYITGGCSRFTVESFKSGKHFTFQATKSDDGRVTFLKVLTDGDSWQYMGLLQTNGSVKLTAKSRFNTTSPAVVAANWACTRLAAGQDLPNARAFRSTTCGRCGRELTHPESYDLGFGPECRKLLGI
jgi:hypothetical protein